MSDPGDRDPRGVCEIERSYRARFERFKLERAANRRPARRERSNQKKKIFANSACSAVRSGLPAAAERAVDLDELGQLGELRIRQPELRDEQSRVGVEDLEVAGRAALIADVRQAAGVLRRGEQQL